MKKLTLLLCFTLMLLLVSCGSSDTQINDTNPTVTKVPQTTNDGTPTTTPTITPTLAPTATPSPTATPVPTATPTPSPTPLPVFGDNFTESNFEGIYNAHVETPQLNDYSYKSQTILGDTMIYIYQAEFAMINEDGEEDISATENEEAVDEDYSFDEEYTYEDTWPIDYVCDIINLNSGEKKSFHFTMNSSYYGTPSPVAIDDNTFFVSMFSSNDVIIFDLEGNIVNSATLSSEDTPVEFDEFGDSYSSINLCYDSNTNIVYYYVNGSNKLYAFSFDSGETSLVCEDNIFCDSYELRQINSNMLSVNYYDNVDYDSVYVFIDTNTGELSTYDTYEYYNYISKDRNELILMTYDECIASVYNTNSEEDIKALLSGQSSDFTPKNVIKLTNKNEIWNCDVDWENRLIITNDYEYNNSYTIVTFKAYTIDEGELLSSAAYRFDSVYYTPTSILKSNSGHLVFENNDEDRLLFAWDYLNSGITNSKKLYVRTNYISQKVDEKRKALEEKFDVYIYLGAEVGDVLISDYNMKICHSQLELYNALDTLDEVFSLYPENFFNQIKCNGISTLGIYLCSGFEKINEYCADNAIAVASSYGYERFLALDVSNYSGDSLAENIVHEISHWIDKTIDASEEYHEDGESDYEIGYQELNPSNFSYCFSYVSGKKYPKYVYDNSSNPEGYFSDEYSQTYPTEDRARLFEYLMYPQYQDYMSSANIRAKLHYYFDYIRKTFDTEVWPEMTTWEQKLYDADMMYGEVIEDSEEMSSDSEEITTDEEELTSEEE